MINEYFDSKPDSIFNAARSVLLNEEEDKFSHSANKNENYARFLDANAKRVGKPMIDGGLRSDQPNADKINGQPVNDIIYVGNGCITFMSKGNKIFMQINPSYLAGNDGTVPWSKGKHYSGNAYISGSASEFKDLAKAVTLAARV
jgi:hypothetical protein